MFFPQLRIRFIMILVSLLTVSLKPAVSQKLWTLEDCVNYALENNLDIQKQIQAVELNKSNLLYSKLNMLPDLNASATNVWNFGKTIDQYTNTFATNTVRSNNFALQSNLVLFNGFQKVNTLKQNQINLLASNFNLDVLKNDISLSVAGYYLDMLFNMELLDVARNQMEITAQQVKRIEKMVDAGSSAKGDLLNIQAQFSAEELTTVEAENRLTISSLTLQQLIDLPVTREFRIDKPKLKEVAAPKELVTPEVIYEKALKARPEIRSAELAVESAQKSLAIARGTVSPSLSFSGSWATGYSGLEKIVDSSVPPVVTTEPIGFVQHTYDTVMGYYSTPATKLKPFGNQLDDNNNKSLGFYLRIPIFNGWQGRTAITQAKIQKTQAEIDLDIRKRELRKTIEQAYADAVAALKKYNTSLEKVAAQQESFNYTQQKFDVGMLTSYDYNNSKKELTRAESELLQAKYDFIFKTTVIDFYMGNPIRIE